MNEALSDMQRTPHRTIRLNAGTRQVQKYIGTDPTLRDSERPENWATVMELRDDEVAMGFVKIAGDVEIAPHPRGTGLIVSGVAGRWAFTTEQIEAMHAALPEHIEAAKNIKAVREVVDAGEVEVGPGRDFETLQAAIAAGPDAVRAKAQEKKRTEEAGASEAT